MNNLLNEKISWKKEIFFLLLIGMLFGFWVRKWKINTYLELLGTVSEENNVVVLVSLEQLPQLLKTKICWLDKKQYTYQVLEVQKDVLVENRHFYKQVVLKVELPSDLLQANSVFSLFISKKQTSIFHILPSCLKEG